MTEKEKIISLHKYYLNASEMFKNFMKIGITTKKPENLSESVEHIIYMSLWYGCLYVVIDGWLRLKISDQDVDKLMIKSKISLLKKYRDKTFHYQTNYFPEEISNVYRDQGFTEWINKVHHILGMKLLERM